MRNSKSMPSREPPPTAIPTRIEQGKLDYKRPVIKELNTVKMSPVYGNGDPNHENTKFWQASPSGFTHARDSECRSRRKQLELGKEYYIDFTPAA